MGRRGPAPTPTNLRVLRGNPGKRALNQNEPKPDADRPACPRWLAPEAKAEWRRVLPQLEATGILTIVDRASLATYCQAWARYVEAERMLSQYGAVLKAEHSDYVQVSPYQTISRQSSQIVKAFATEFGLTPGSRSRITVPEVKGQDEFEEFLQSGETQS